MIKYKVLKTVVSAMDATYTTSVWNDYERQSFEFEVEAKEIFDDEDRFLQMIFDNDIAEPWRVVVLELLQYDTCEPWHKTLLEQKIYTQKK